MGQRRRVHMGDRAQIGQTLMSRITLIMLAGSIRESPLRRDLKEPVFALPIAPGISLLDAWLRVIEQLPGELRLRIVVNNATDARRARQQLRTTVNAVDRTRLSIEVIEESASWRGSAGIIMDVTDDVAADEPIFALEVGCLPPKDLLPVLETLDGPSDDQLMLVIAADPDATPSGVSAMKKAALDHVNKVGFSDLKEQLIPAINKAGGKVGLCELDETAIRIRDRESYLGAIQQAQQVVTNQTTKSNAKQDQAWRSLGVNLIGKGVCIGSGAIIHDSIILPGANIADRALISRSVIGRDVEIVAQQRVMNQVQSLFSYDDVDFDDENEHATHDETNNISNDRDEDDDDQARSMRVGA